MNELSNILSKKQIVETGYFILKEDFNKYIKGYIIAKYNGRILDTNSALDSANKVSQVFDLKFISNGNEIFETEPNYEVYEKSPQLLDLFKCSKKVKIEIKTEENDSEYVEKYTITSENIELLSSFNNKPQNPYQGIFHQREEKEEYGTFKGDALLTYKHTKEYKYTVKFDDFISNGISVYDDEENLIDTVVCDYEPDHLYFKNGQLFVNTLEMDYKIHFIDGKLYLSEVIDETLESKEVFEKDLIGTDRKSNPIVRPKKPYTGKLDGGGCFIKFFEIIGLLIVLIVYGSQILMFLWMIFQLFYEFPSLLLIVGFIGLIALLNWLLPKIINTVFIPIGSLILRIFTPLIAIVFVGWLVISLFSILPNLRTQESRSFNYSEDSVKEKKNPVYDKYDEMIRINRIWEDYKGIDYEITFDIALSDVNRSKSLKSSIVGDFEYKKESEIYSQLFDNEKLYLSNMILKLDSIKDTNNLNEIEFANVLMSFVQDIPYALVLQSDCDISNYLNDKFVFNYLSEGGKCIGYEKFGVLTPTEFIYNTNGDCDSRTVFSHLIFKHFGYEVAIFNSNVYAHSIFGIHLESKSIKGAYKIINDKKYFLWETTSKGFKMGEIPSEIGNLNYWYQVLN